MGAERLKAGVAALLATCFGIGYFPVAPGTVASIVAAGAWYLLPALQQPQLLLPLTLFAALAGIWAGGEMEKTLGEDPSAVVIDEVAGQWVALLFLPSSLVAVLLALFFFRLYDIWKPGPVDAAQRLPGGWGIMADDLLAGLLANLSTWAVFFFIAGVL